MLILLNYSKISSVGFVEDNDTDGVAIDSLTITGTTFGVANLATGALANNIVITDQYGAAVLATATTGAVAFADGTTYGAPTVTVTPVKGSIVIANNGLTTAAVTGVDAGEEFNVKLAYAGGATATIKVKK